MAEPERTIQGATPIAVLVGPPGSGKTTIGRALADLLYVPFRDTDEDIEKDTGRSISDIFVESGETFFREYERRAVDAALHAHAGVLSVGGGAVTSEVVRTALQDHYVVFLEVGLSAAMARLEMNRSRPLLLGNVRAQWQALAAERLPLYQQVADFSVETDGLTVDAIVGLIVENLRQAGKVS